MSYKREKLNSVSYDYEYFSQNTVCRLCWTENAVNLISNSEIDIKGGLLDKIHYCLDINIDSNGITNKLCDECYRNVDRFYEFKLFCTESDRRLQELLSVDFHDNCPIGNEIKLEIDVDAGENDAYNSDNDEDPLIDLQKRKYNKTQHPDFYCKKCQIVCKDDEGFRKHNKDIHGVLSEGLYQCEGCEKHFNFERSRRSHELKYCKSLKKGYFCSTCDGYLPNRKMYESHKSKHLLNIPIQLPENVFKCLKCNKKFKTREVLVKHFDDHHRKKKRFVCEQCGRVFRRLDYLNKHMLVHNGVKKHVCPHCGHRTAQKTSLNIHLRKHTGDKPFQCDLCPLKCLTSSNLKRHKLTHAGVKNYECDLCSKKFGYKMSLEEHIAATHDRIKSFMCNVCHTSYSRSGGLRRHVRAKHGKTKIKSTELFQPNSSKLTEFKNKSNFIIENIDNNF